MSKSSDLLSAAQKLAAAERLDLVERLLDGLDKPDDTVDSVWLDEARDRLTAYRRGEINAVPLSDVLAKYSAR